MGFAHNPIFYREEKNVTQSAKGDTVSPGCDIAACDTYACLTSPGPTGRNLLTGLPSLCEDKPAHKCAGRCKVIIMNCLTLVSPVYMATSSPYYSAVSSLNLRVASCGGNASASSEKLTELPNSESFFFLASALPALRINPNL